MLHCATFRLSQRRRRRACGRRWTSRPPRWSARSSGSLPSSASATRCSPRCWRWPHHASTLHTADLVPRMHAAGLFSSCATVGLSALVPRMHADRRQLPVRRGSRLHPRALPRTSSRLHFARRRHSRRPPRSPRRRQRARTSRSGCAPSSPHSAPPQPISRRRYGAPLLKLPSDRPVWRMLCLRGIVAHMLQMLSLPW